MARHRDTQCTKCSVLMVCSQCEGWGQGKDSGCIAWSKPWQEVRFFFHTDYDSPFKKKECRS